MRSKLPAIAACIVAAGMVTALSTVASASTDVVPDVHISNITYHNNPTQNVPCHFSTTGPIENPTDISQVHNNCSVRIWLHVHPGQSSPALCIRPNSVATIGATYREWFVSDNPNSC